MGTETPVIELERGTCTSCGLVDTTIGETGICLHCQLVSISNTGSNRLMAKALLKALRQMNNLVASYADKINLAHLKAEDKAVKVGLSIDLFQKKRDRIDFKCNITFIESKVKDETDGFVEEQEPLPI